MYYLLSLLRNTVATDLHNNRTIDDEEQELLTMTYGEAVEESNGVISNESGKIQ